MAFQISVPAVSGQSAKIILCNLEDEHEALTAAETLLGYRIIGLPYIVTELESEMVAQLGLRPGTCSFVDEAL
jgi:hypothetical protein